MSSTRNPSEKSVAVTATERQLDFVISFLCSKFDVIARAHFELDVPLEDLVCSAVRKAISKPAHDDHQPSLFDNRMKEKF